MKTLVGLAEHALDMRDRTHDRMASGDDMLESDESESELFSVLRRIDALAQSKHRLFPEDLQRIISGGVYDG